jgi:hypothetical protein
MLTDIFSDRYIGTQMWDEFTHQDERFLVQGYRIIIEQLFPYYINGKEDPSSKVIWTSIHDKLSMELGLTELSPRHYHFQSNYQGKPVTHNRTWSMDKVCKDFINAPYDTKIPADRFIKERLSFIELAFREREKQISKINAAHSKMLKESPIEAKRIVTLSEALMAQGGKSHTVQSRNGAINNYFRDSVNELNERMRRSGYNLNYHNGFIQISDDTLIEAEIENQFWQLTSGPLWENVDIDMKEAIDLRDSNGRDPAFYAARALESAIKIISDQKQWTHGKENGAHNYLENLGSKKNGNFITDWERDAMKAFFTSVRNPFGHGAGSDEMPKLTKQQTDWAIATCMSWVKSLILRM